MKAYSCTGDSIPVYSQFVVTDSHIVVGDFSTYHDTGYDPLDFQKRNVLHHILLTKIFTICLASGIRFFFNGSNYAQQSLSTYLFLISEEWGAF